jgi:hypothetical protein
MPSELIPDDEEYASSEDSDFAPDDAPAQASENSDDDESDAEETVKETKKAKPKPAKRKRGQDEEAEDAGFENSGDEAIIERGLKKQRRKKGKGVEDEDEGGEGGLVKTRSMRAQEYVLSLFVHWELLIECVRKVEKKPLADTAAATVDVDALWASMISGKPKPTNPDLPSEGTTSAIDDRKSSIPEIRRNAAIPEGRKDSRSPSTTLKDGANTMIMIKQTYNFAGKVHSVEKLVPRNSAEAKLFLASQPTDIEPSKEDSSSFTKPKRPIKKARRSVFEPVSDLPIRTDLHFGVRKDSSGVTIVGAAGKDAKKLNTVEKSAMDWAGFVDKEGIKDELDAAGKSKGAYKARQEFLARVEQKKEEDSRRARGLPVL